ncbi:RnfH family protein [Paraferrimonas haliotis]|uniref:RnfH family protein n=1 Tax=Paraferrimonas haliotis TaxID=2013866 RepID=UPI0015CA97C0|nr:RnfH family protein [Paraferrimonas haliotis]
MVSNTIEVEVVYPLANEQKVFSVSLEQGATVEQAIHLSGVEKYYPDVDFSALKVGIYSRIVKRSELLENGQRVELYRPLIADPKDVRRQRAAKAVEEGRANKTTGAKTVNKDR